MCALPRLCVGGALPLVSDGMEVEVVHDSDGAVRRHSARSVGGHAWRGLLLALVLSLVAACGQPEEPTPPPTPTAMATSTVATDAVATSTTATATTTLPAEADAASTQAAQERATAMWAALTPSSEAEVAASPTSPSIAVAQGTSTPEVVGTAPPSADGTAQPGVGPGVGGGDGAATTVGGGPGLASGDATATTVNVAEDPTATPEPTVTPEPTATPDPCPGAIPWDQAAAYAGQQVTVIGPVVGATWATDSRGQPTFLNIGLPYPDPGRFTVLIWIDARWNFPDAPELLYTDRTICVSGAIEVYNGVPEVEVLGPEQIIVAD